MVCGVHLVKAPPGAGKGSTVVAVSLAFTTLARCDSLLNQLGNDLDGTSLSLTDARRVKFDAQISTLTVRFVRLRYKLTHW